MNDHTDLQHQRLVRELRTAAQHVELTPGNELAVVTHGRRRQVRRRRATGLALVVTIGGGTALGVQQLARTGDSGIAIDEPLTTMASTVPVAPEPSVPVPADTVPEPTTAPAPAATPADHPLAQVVDSNVAWTVVEPDSASAIAYIQTTGEVYTVPMVGLSTAPGSGDDYEPMFWRTDDGITWEAKGVEPPVGAPYNAVFDGTKVYTVGTAPGVAATEPNPMVFASSNDLGTTWDQLELPIDANGGRALPLVSGIGISASAVPVPAGVVVVVQRFINLDYQELAKRSDLVTDGFYGEGPDGVLVANDASCTGGTDRSLVPLDAAPATVPMETAPGGPCDLVELSWDELGVPAETVAARTAPSTWAFLVADGSATQLDVPDGALFSGAYGSRVMFSDEGGSWFELNDDLAIVPAESGPGMIDPTSGGWTIGERDGVTFWSSQLSTVFGGWTELYGASTDGTVAWTNWSDLYGPDHIASRPVRNLTGAGLTTVAVVTPDPTTEGAEVSGGGLTVRRDSMRTDPVFSFTETGDVIDLSQVRVESNSGDFVVVDDAGAEIARMRAEVGNSVVYGGYGSPDQVPTSAWYVETSSDGVNVATESIADLLGVNDEDISSVPRISTDGTNVIVAVTMKERNPEGVPKQLVLVGTPKT